MSDAIFEQKNKLQALVVAASCGVLTSVQFFKLSTYLYAIDCPAIKMTTRQTLVILVPKEKIPDLLHKVTEIGLVVGKFGQIIRNVKGCSGGEGLCPRALGDALGLGIELQERYFGQTVPKDFKISTAGCGRACTDPLCADFGIIAKGTDCFDIYLGGRGGSPYPLKAQLLIAKVSRKDVFVILDHVLAIYRAQGEPHERICKTIKRLGLPAFRSERIQSQAEKVDENFLAFLGNT